MAGVSPPQKISRHKKIQRLQKLQSLAKNRAQPKAAPKLRLWFRSSAQRQTGKRCSYCGMAGVWTMMD
jgi:hypothetical protein